MRWRDIRSAKLREWQALWRGPERDLPEGFLLAGAFDGVKVGTGSPDDLSDLSGEVEWIGDEPFRLCSWGGYDLNQFHSPKQFTGPARCDLHPRWSRDGRQVCIDSVHESARQMYVIDLSALIA